ncbi:MAG: hypothetical protein R2836_01895 [Chitinophagales bacterium]
MSPTIGSYVDSLNIQTLGVRTDFSTLNFHGYLGDVIIFNDTIPDLPVF